MEFGSQQRFDIMGDDVQLAVVALVEEPAAAALLPTQGVAAI
jgi:hypothetical protein